MSNETPNTPATPVIPAAVTSTPETAPAVDAAPAVVVPPKPSPSSPQFEALAKKERALRQKELEAKTRETELAAKESEYSRFAKLKEEAKTNPLKVLEEMGIKYQDVVDYMLNNGAPSTELKLQRMSEEVAAIRKEKLEEAERMKTDSVAKAQQEKEAATAEFKTEISTFLSNNKDTYEFANLVADSHEIIYATMDDYYAAHGKVLSLEEASQIVDEYLYTTYFAPALNTKKLKSQLALAPAKDEKPATPSKTLSNVTSSMPSSLPPKTEQDRLQRALAALERKI